MNENSFRQLPAIARLLEHALLVAARERHPHHLVAAAAREEVDALRQRLAAGENADLTSDAAARRIATRLDADATLRIRPVINATGIVLHTNLGRALHEKPHARLRSRARLPQS